MTIIRPAALAAILTGVLVPSGTAAADPPTDRELVCNQAQSAVIQGNAGKTAYDTTGSTPSDPDPPARHKSAAMHVGNGAGLVRAAENSPALALCEAGEEPPT